MNTDIVIRKDNASVMVPPNASGSQKRALSLYARWLDAQGIPWYQPDLAAYRDSLLERLSPASAAVYLSTIRARYQRILRDNSMRDILYSAVGERLAELGMDDTPANRAAMVNELYTRLENAVHPSNSQVKRTKIQDLADSETGLRLNRAQVEELRKLPNLDTLKGKRDRAMLAVLLATGIREGELCALSVADLRQTYQGMAALRIRHGKGDKRRMVVLGKNEWALAVVQVWLDAALIDSGPVFRAINRWDSVAEVPLTTRGVRAILAEYPLSDGTKIHPHDCRRTYARAWYDAKGDILALAQNLGHCDVKTTMGYIGLLDAKIRAAPTMYNPWSE